MLKMFKEVFGLDGEEVRDIELFEQDNGTCVGTVEQAGRQIMLKTCVLQGEKNASDTHVLSATATLMISPQCAEDESLPSLEAVANGLEGCFDEVESVVTCSICEGEIVVELINCGVFDDEREVPRMTADLISELLKDADTLDPLMCAFEEGSADASSFGKARAALERCGAPVSVGNVLLALKLEREYTQYNDGVNVEGESSHESEEHAAESE